MKILKFADIEPIAPHGSPLYRYESLEAPDVTVNIAVMKPGDKQDHPAHSNNVMFVLQGAPTCTGEDGTVTVLGPNDAVAFGGGDYRNMSNDTDQDVLLLLIEKKREGGPGGPGGPGMPPPPPQA